MITVFTPTFNRGYIIGKLYNSLLNQSNMDFEWLIIDDGSEDNTHDIINGFIKTAPFPIRYYRVKNGGKHRAINYGVKLAIGDLFFIVDSDDYLTPNAIERLSFHYSKVRDNNEIAGVFGLRIYENGKINGFKRTFSVIDSTPGRIKRYLTCDKAEAVKLSVMKEFPFPEFDGEKFISEGAVWNRIAKKYKFRYFFEPIYVCEYLEDGLTKSIVRQHRKSPLGTLLVYKEKIDASPYVKEKIKAAINYWRYRPCVKLCPKDINLSGIFAMLAPIGYWLYIKDSLVDDKN